MKKVLSWTFVLIFVLSMLLAAASCSSSETPATGETPSSASEETLTSEPAVGGSAYDIVSAAIAKMNALTSYEVDMESTSDMKIVMAGMTQTAVTPTTSHTRLSGAGTDAQIYESIQEAETMGQKYKTTIYGDKDYVYVDMFGNKTRYAANSEEAKNYYPSASNESTLLPEKECFDGAEVKQGEGLTKTVSLSLTEEQFKRTFGDYIDSIAESISGGLGARPDVTISDVKLSYTVLSSGYLGVYGMDFKMKMKMNVQGMDADVDATISSVLTYIDPGKEVTVTLPDLTDYTDYSEIPDFDV